MIRQVHVRLFSEGAGMILPALRDEFSTPRRIFHD
jgi:hypothetical protein